jgi:hypothetical protein
MLEIPVDSFTGKAQTTQTQLVQFVKSWILTQRDVLARTLEDGCTHLRVRRVGNSLVIDAFRIVESERTSAWRLPDPAVTGGIWFTRALTYIYHAMPPIGPLPPSAMTIIAHPF